MRAVAELLAELQQRSVRLWHDEGRLHYQAPPGALSPELLEEMRDQKPALLASCRRRPAAPPLSTAQYRLWLHDRAHGPDPAYNIALALRLHGRLDAAALRHSLAALLKRHEPLRTAFRDDGGRVVQAIAPDPALPWATVDLRGLAPGLRVEAARQQAAEEAARPFDLGQAPLMRCGLWQVADDDHVLLLLVHHIVADGPSIAVLAGELGALYAARRAGQAAQLPALHLQQADLAWQEQESRDDAALHDSMQHWQRRLAGLPPLHGLPTDRPRPRVPHSAGAAIGWTLDAAITARLRRVAGAAGTTPYGVLLAAVALLLARYTGATDLAIACPVTRRDRPELERLVGFFVDTVALRIDLSDPDGRLSFRDLLARVRDTLAEDLRRPRVPFHQVATALGLAPAAGQPPYIAASVAMVDARDAVPSLPGLAVQPFQLGNPTARYELSLEIHAAPAGFELYWIYATTLFDAGTARAMRQHLHRLLDAALQEPERAVATLPMLDAEERRLALGGADDAAAAWDADDPAGFVHARVQAQARRTPDAVAVTAGDRHCRYGELEAAATRLARRLRRLGVGPDVRVGVSLERSIDLVAGLLGVLKAGGAYVPFDPDHPPARLAAMLADAAPAVLLTHSALAALPELPPGTRVLCIDQDGGDPADAGEPLPAAALQGHHLAYVLYTSGSTGVPKGVMIPHRALANHMRWMAAEFALGADDAVLQRTPCSFDASVWEFYAPLMAGARLVMAEPGRHADPEALLHLVQQQRVTVLQAVPTLLTLLAEAPEFDHCPSLRRIFSGGETLTTALAQRLARGGAEVVNLYGPTEATIDATFCRWDGRTDSATVPIGRPIAQLRTYVLDAHGEPVPPGAVGELVIAGAGVARGYLNRPALTAERFVPDPHAPPQEREARMYRSGDRVRRLADGRLELQGRSDRQVKLRGVRIELDEVEAALGSHPSVSRCAVALCDTPRGPVLVAWVAGDAPAPAAALRAHLRPRLPDAALPAVFVALPGLPTTPSGKIDRQALAALAVPLPDWAGAAGPATPPRTPTEAALAALWAELLGQAEVGVDDDFLDLGGHSLAAMQLAGRLRQGFGLDLPAQHFFDGATVASLARRVDEAAARRPERAALPTTASRRP